MGSHPVEVVQYTYTHKQYRERHKTLNTQNTKIYRKQKIHRTTQKLVIIYKIILYPKTKHTIPVMRD